MFYKGSIFRIIGIIIKLTTFLICHCKLQFERHDRKINHHFPFSYKDNDKLIEGYLYTRFYYSYVVVSILHRQTMKEQYLLIIRQNVNSDLLVVAKIFNQIYVVHSVVRWVSCGEYRVQRVRVVVQRVPSGGGMSTVKKFRLIGCLRFFLKNLLEVF